jgi:hypothetical protein
VAKFSAGNDLSYARILVNSKIYYIILDTPTPRASLADSGGWEGPPWGEGCQILRGAASKVGQPGGGRVPLGGRGILNPRVPSPPIAPGHALELKLLLDIVLHATLSVVSTPSNFSNAHDKKTIVTRGLYLSLVKLNI